jgi:glutamyl/glutaminyl-tRNA synthetase
MPEWLSSLTAHLEKLTSFTAPEIKQAIHDFAEAKSIPAGNLMNCLRLCLVGSSMGPDLALICEILGTEEIKQRIEKAVAVIGNGVH